MIEQNTQTGQRPGIARPATPAAVRNAARVMYAGATASVARAVVSLETEGATRTALEHRYPRLSAHSITTLTHVTVIAVAVVALIGAVIYIWLARKCTEGKNWARITATVLGALEVLGAFLGLDAGRSPADVVVGFVIAAIWVAAICMLWQRGSTAYFEDARRA